MKKLRLRSWVQTFLIMWTATDIFLIVLYLYMLRMVEIGWV